MIVILKAIYGATENEKDMPLDHMDRSPPVSWVYHEYHRIFFLSECIGPEETKPSENILYDLSHGGVVRPE